MATLTTAVEIPYNWNHDWKRQDRAYDAAIKAAQRQFRRKDRGEWVGAIISWSVADGYATYMVAQQNPLVMAHVFYGDGYEVDPIMIRGLELSDIESRCAKPV
jgi:hypothetical protein